MSHPIHRLCIAALPFLLCFHAPGILAQTLQVLPLPVGCLLEWSAEGDPEGSTYHILLQSAGLAPVAAARLRAGSAERDRMQFLLTELTDEPHTHIHLRVVAPDGRLFRQESVPTGASWNRTMRIIAILHQEASRRLVLEAEIGMEQTVRWLLQDKDRKDLRRGQWDLNQGLHRLDPDLEGLPAGSYFLFLQGADDQHTLNLRISDRGSVLAGPVE